MVGYQINKKSIIMKKNIIVLISFLALILASCGEKKSANISSITYFPEFTVNGDAEYFLGVGDPFNDPGVTAQENGVDIPVSYSVAGEFFGYSGADVPTDNADKYVITYSATNSDGYDGTATRTVWVVETGDLVTSIAGLYTSTIVRNGDAGNPQYTDLEYIMISNNGDGTYNLSDAIGGYYALGRGYGGDYAAAGLVITANDIPSNSFSFNDPIGVGAFGGNLLITAFSVDAGAGTIDFTGDWDQGYVFEVTLTQVTL
jgi:hypothetical protein